MSTANPYHVLMVCTGNICRSPMAELLCRDYAEARGRVMEVRSAGTAGLIDQPADPKAVAVCRELDLDLSAHRSQGITDELIAWADYVLVMEYAHASYVREHFPAVGEKLMLLGTFGGMVEIADPLGGWTFRFRRSRNDIKKCVDGFVDRLPVRRAP